ncbi:P-loop containing nucleoside triphosphate hydrolase protein [Nemania sp. NC0429]|nr:P-loop containing nucleoside triphosphate hydrolase protein [Nemania sp. NC0429]
MPSSILNQLTVDTKPPHCYRSTLRNKQHPISVLTASDQLELSELKPDKMADKFKSTKESIQSFMASIAESQPASGNLQEMISELICEHLDDLDHRMTLLTDAIADKEYANEKIATQISLFPTHIESGFRTLVENVGRTIEGANTDYRGILKGFEGQIEQLHGTNATLQATINHFLTMEPAHPSSRLSTRPSSLASSDEPQPAPFMTNPFGAEPEQQGAEPKKQGAESKQQGAESKHQDAKSQQDDQLLKLTEYQIELKARQDEIDRLKTALKLAESKSQQDDQLLKLTEYQIELKARQDEIDRLQTELKLVESNKASAIEQASKQREAALIAKHEAESRLFAVRYRAVVEELADAKGNIRVLCRIRPEDAPEEDLLKFADPDEHPSLPWSKLRVTYLNESKKIDNKDFNFQRAFGRGESNQVVFDEVSDFAKSAVFGNNACIMAYGATGTGKSYLFLSEDGLVHSYVALLFQLAEQEKASCEYEFNLSAIEIYLNKVFDLLQPPVKGEKTEVRLSQESTAKLESQEQASTIIKQAIGRREAASTKQNATSSRSHFIISIKISRRPSGNEKRTESTISFTDLAGSEAAGKNLLAGGTGNNPKQALIYEQGQDINSGLLDLGKGIRSLAKRDTFIPSHNLTRALRSTLTPGSRLLLVTTISSLVANQSNTMTTLRWSQDAIGPSGTPGGGAGRPPPNNSLAGRALRGNAKPESSAPSVSSRSNASSRRAPTTSTSSRR